VLILVLVGQDEVMNGDGSDSSSAFQVLTAKERPDLWIKAGVLSEVWPEYNRHGNLSEQYFGSLMPKYEHLQVVIYDQSSDQIVARGRSIPFQWDGSLDDLPTGIDALGMRALEDQRSPTALSALAVEVAEEVRGRGVSRLVILALAEVAGRAGLDPLVAPVRPSWKDRYPLIPIEHYAYWQREDGTPFDPWIRVHARLGASILRTEPQSLHIEASVADWQSWTGSEFPADGDYTFPFGLAPLHVEEGTGVYWEPNVWMLHVA
jgi:GNAT superfamily N-acetyltransferase